MPDIFSAADIVRVGNQAAMAGWLILIFLPRHAALIAIPKYVIPLGLSLLYGPLILPHFVATGGGYGSLEAVRLLFAHDQVLAAGWVHYLAFDLFVGAWIAQDADRLGVPRTVQAGLLLLTFLFGPIGFAVYVLARSGYFLKTASPEVLP